MFLGYRVARVVKGILEGHARKTGQATEKQTPSMAMPRPVLGYKAENTQALKLYTSETSVPFVVVVSTGCLLADGHQDSMFG